MIVIYIRSWNANALTAGAMDSTQAAAELRADGFEVALVNGYSPDRNTGCSCDTDEEEAAVLDLPLAVDIRETYAKLGFDVVGTGGGCTAYAHSDFAWMDERPHILVTVEDDAHVPTNGHERIAIGFYNGVDPEAIFETTWTRADDIEMALRLICAKRPDLAAQFNLDKILRRPCQLIADTAGFSLHFEADGSQIIQPVEA